MFRASGPPWPELYEVELSGSSRSGDSAVSTFGAAERLELILHPKQRLEDDPEIDFYLQAEGGDVVAWRVGSSRSSDGVVKIEGKIGEDLGIGPGTWTLWVVYGRPGRLPPAESLGLDTPEATLSWRVLRLPLRIESEVNGRLRSVIG